MFSAKGRGQGGGARTKTTFTLLLVRGPHKRSLAYQVSRAERSSYPLQYADKRPGVSIRAEACGGLFQAVRAY